MRSLYLIDDHPIIASAIRGVVVTMEGYAFLGSASTIDAAFEDLEKLKPDIIVTDFNVGANGGYGLIKNLKLKFPSIPVLLFTVADESRVGPRAFKEGVHGVITKGSDVAVIREAITTVADGGKWASETLLRQILEESVSGNAEESLTTRELQVYTLLGQGESSKSIACHLGISVKTVESHRENIKIKLNITNSHKLQAIARDYYLSIS